ncbi:MAG TPA: pentapeptide repeat-containing protein, partial [Planctomycetaceae bacterium]
LWHDEIILPLATDQLVGQLRSSAPDNVLEFSFPEVLIRDAARLIRTEENVLARLSAVVSSGATEMHATAASLLDAADFGWRPAQPPEATGWRVLLPHKRIIGPRLYGAFLRDAAWPGIDLSRFEFGYADLSGSDLTGAKLDVAFAAFANLRAATLTSASMEQIYADDACLAGADLSHVLASRRQFQNANAERACFEGAMLKGASFHGANLKGARFVRANLSGAGLVAAEIEGADFSQVEFRGARLTGLVLSKAEFRQCSFREAQLLRCDLEGMVLPGADFREADLKGALLTGSVMPHADFRGANLVKTGVAEIELENADLREANLRGASFHMGSSRSGLVDSPIASFGTRTGFYTDDYNEQDFKSLEEIRKANLRGADLRGANIDGVDFYLVDLRDALYDASQEQQLRSTGAILESRVP